MCIFIYYIYVCITEKNNTNAKFTPTKLKKDGPNLEHSFVRISDSQKPLPQHLPLILEKERLG